MKCWIPIYMGMTKRAGMTNRGKYWIPVYTGMTE